MLWERLSLSAFMIGILCWIYQLLLQTGSSGPWLTAVLMGFLGTVSSIIGLIRNARARGFYLVLANLLMILSPFLMWTLGTWLWGPTA